MRDAAFWGALRVSFQRALHGCTNRGALLLRRSFRHFHNIWPTCVTIMHIENIIRYATLLSLAMGGFGLAIAVLNRREQVKTQIFLALSARYDEQLRSSSAGLWLSMPPGMELPESTDDLTISVLRFCTLVSLTYLLFLERRIPKRMWELMLRSAERRFRSPIFVREWKHLRTEFEGFPEFVTLVTSVQCMHNNIENFGAGSALFAKKESKRSQC
jgi:hypothetical protein